MTWILLDPARGSGSGLVACAASFRGLRAESPRDSEVWRRIRSLPTQQLCSDGPALGLHSLRVSGRPPRSDTRAFPSRTPRAEFEAAALDRSPGSRDYDDRLGRQCAPAAGLRWWRQPTAPVRAAIH